MSVLQYPTKKELSTPSVKPISIPDVHPDVHKTALERHRQAQMSPLIYQLLTRGEIKLPVLLEDYKSYGSVPPVHQLFQPLRQSVYAIIFNLHHQRFNRKQAEDAVKTNRRKADELRKQAKVGRDLLHTYITCLLISFSVRRGLFLLLAFLSS